MQVGDKIKIQGTNTFWDGKTGVIEAIDDDVATIMIDFIPEEGKKVRQEFSIDTLDNFTVECYNIKESLREDMGKIIKELDWNGHHYTFENTFRSTGTKNHDILTMTDENGNSWTGETTWINRPWHRFDLEEAFTEVVSKAFGPKAEKLILEINNNAHSVYDAIDKFFKQFKPEDISSHDMKTFDDSEEARRQALANYLEVSVDTVESNDNNEFNVNGETYRVLTDEEADYEFDDRIRSLWDEMGLELVSSYMRDWILENALDEDALESLVREEIERDVYDWLDETEVVDRCIDYDIVEKEDVYDEDDNIKEDVDLDSLKEKLVDSEFENIDNYAEYLFDRGYEEDVLSDYIDEETVIEALKDDIDVNGSGRGQELSYFDGEELDLGNNLYAYRID